MTEKPSEETSHESNIDLQRFLPPVVLIVVIGGGLLYLNSVNTQKQKLQEDLVESSGTNLELQEKLANLESVVSDLKTAKVYEEEAKAVAAVGALQVVERCQLLQNQVEQIARLQSQYSDLSSELAASSTGRRIASNDGLVAQMSAVMDSTIPSPDTANRLGSQVNFLMQAPQKALNEQVADYQPSAQLISTLEATEREADRVLGQLERAVGDIQSIAKAAADLPESSDYTLKEALAEYDDRSATERRQRVAQTIEDAKQEAAEMLAEQEAANQRQLAEARRKAAEMVADEKASQVLADARDEELKLQSEIQAREAANARAKLEKEFARDKPEIQRILVAMLADGNMLRGDLASKGPASLTVLAGKGVLSEGRSGIEALCGLASLRNDRPRGPLPFFDGRYDWWEQVDREIPAKAQQFLIKYGELMVEKEMLAP
jgi:hypothetical protein